MAFIRILPAMILFALAAVSCEKELDIKYHDVAPKTVIEAYITESGPEVLITLTTPMDEPMDRTPLTDATVTVTDLSTGLESSLTPDKDGRFRSALVPVAGHSYGLTVSRGGQSFSAVSTMTPPPHIEGMEFSWVEMPYDDVAALQITFSDNDPDLPGECYWLRVFRNGEPYMWSAIRDDLSVDGTINEVLTTSRKDTEEEDEDQLLVDGDVVSVLVSQISREMYDYLQAIRSDSNGPQMFSGDFCLGFFLAAGQASSSVTFHPDEIPYLR